MKKLVCGTFNLRSLFGSGEYANRTVSREGFVQFCPSSCRLGQNRVLSNLVAGTIRKMT